MDQHKNNREVQFEYMVPSSTWTHTSNTHRLAIHLPGFKKEDVRIRAGEHGRLLVSGERQVSKDNKLIHFQQAFKVPPDSAIDDTSGNLEDGTFTITIPRKPKQHRKAVKPKEQDQCVVPAGNSSGHQTELGQHDQEETEEDEVEEEFHDTREYEWDQDSMFEKLSIMLKKNGIYTVVVAFSMGVGFATYLCKFKSHGK